jgi:hypothetical protein
MWSCTGRTSSLKLEAECSTEASVNITALHCVALGNRIIDLVLVTHTSGRLLIIIHAMSEETLLRIVM